MYRIKFLDGTEKEFDTLVGADLREADLRWADLGEANLRWTDLSGANLSGADLRGADLEGASLSGANLYGTDLSRADLRRADLEGASLSGANLYGAALRHCKGVLRLNLGKHELIQYKDRISIGCQDHTIEHWVSHAESIGKNNDYTKEEIQRYKFIIDSISKGLL